MRVRCYVCMFVRLYMCMYYITGFGRVRALLQFPTRTTAAKKEGAGVGAGASDRVGTAERTV